MAKKLITIDSGEKERAFLVVVDYYQEKPSRFSLDEEAEELLEEFPDVADNEE